MHGTAKCKWRIVLASALLCIASAAAKPIEISASISFSGLDEVVPQDPSTNSYCQDLVLNVSLYRPSSIMFAPNTFFEIVATANSSQVLVTALGLQILLRQNMHTVNRSHLSILYLSSPCFLAVLSLLCHKLIGKHGDCIAMAAAQKAIDPLKYP